MAREREIKLGAPPGFRLPGLQGVDELRPETLEALHLQTVYVDTPDFRLARWGLSLRHRSGEGWTLKLPARSEGVLLERNEITFPGDPKNPPEPALDLIRSYVRTAPVKVTARLKTVRRRVRLADPNGHVLAEVDEDEVSVLDGRRLASRFREVEVEIAEDMPAETLAELMQRLREAGAGSPDPTPKYVRAIGPRALEPNELVVPEPGPDDPAGAMVRHSEAASVARLITHHPGVRLGEDPEDVHQARVATRRLRSDLRTFAPLLDQAWASELRGELKWLGGLLGAVRDTDVLLGRLRERSNAFPPSEQDAASRLLQGLEASRDRARSRLLAGMSEPRYVALLDRLVDAARSPRLTPEASERAVVVLRPLLARPWWKLRRAEETMGHVPTDEELHALRIKTKRCRYAAEAVAPVLGRPAKRFARAAASLQDVLGEHQDGIVAQRWLREAGAKAQGATAFVAGELAGMENESAAQARDAWRGAWRKLAAAWSKLER